MLILPQQGIIGGSSVSNVDTDYFTEVLNLSHLDLFYKMEEASGACNDSSGNAVHLDVITNAPTYGQPSIIPSQAETCTKWGNSSDELRSTLAPTFVGNADWSFGGWVAGGSSGTNELLEIKTSSWGVPIRTNTGRWLRPGRPFGSIEMYQNGDTTRDYLNAPYGQFVGITHDASASLFYGYLNGILINSYAAGTNWGSETSQYARVHCGAAGVGAKSIQGLFYTTDLVTAAEMLELYYAGVAGNINGPIP